MKVDRFPRRHPLCTCPDLTGANLANLDRAQCAGGSIAHPVITADDAARLVEAFKERHDR